VLKINEDTGVSDIALDRKAGHAVRPRRTSGRRTPYGFNGGGPGSAILQDDRRRRDMEEIDPKDCRMKMG